MSAMEFLKRKAGPLPTWAWMAIGLGGAVMFSSWQRNKAAGQQEATSTTGIQLPESVQPTYAFVDADTTNITWPGAPPGGGRPPTTTPPVTTDPVTPRPGGGGSAIKIPVPGRPAPVVTPVKPVATPPGKYVTVAAWNSTKAPWNSTVWGIAQQLLGPKASWQTVWSAPQNASLRAKRGDPTKIQAGDKIWVPGAK